MKVWVIIVCSLVVIALLYIFAGRDVATVPSDQQIELWQIEHERKMEEMYEKWDRIAEEDRLWEEQKERAQQSETDYYQQDGY